MEASRHLVPAKVHDGHEGGLHEEGDDALDSQRRSEDVAHEPRVVGPVGAKLELEDDACGDAHGEVDAEEALPELGGLLPEGSVGLRGVALADGLLCAIVACLDDAHDDGQTERQGNEEPVVDCRERELGSRPVDGRGIDG